MISIGRIGAADAARYYLDRQAGCQVDYYTGSGEAQGQWRGDGSRSLGLTGAMDESGEAALRALLSGCGVDGAQLIAPVLRADSRRRLPAEPLLAALEEPGVESLPRRAESAMERLRSGTATTVDVDVVRTVTEAAGLDPVALYKGKDGTDRYGAALSHAGAQVDIRRAGLDVTVSAPKSVSLLYGLGDTTVATAAKAAHETAVGEVITYLQRHAATAARGHHGGGQTANRIRTDGLIVASFDHRASRAGDPQLHTHLVIPNLVRGEDGRWSAMDTAAIYRHARTASSVYHVVLRGEFTRTLGVGWTEVRRGIAEIDGISATARNAFSKRRAQIEAALARRGATSARAAQAACLDTRPSKRKNVAGTLRDRWASEAKDAGIAPTMIGSVLDRHTPPGPPDLDQLAARLFGPEGLTADRTTFTRQDLARAVCEAIPAGRPVTLPEIDRIVSDLVTRPEVVPVLPDARRERRYTTTELLAVEQTTLQAASTECTGPAVANNWMTVEHAISMHDLSDEQATMVRALVKSTRRVDVIAGQAGSGKTAGLAAAHRVWSMGGVPVRGASLSWLAAGQLESATGIPSASLTKTLTDADRYGLPAGVVLVLDEASLVNTRTLYRLIAHVAAANGHLVLVGDPHQLPEIGAGGVFATLAERPDAIQLTGNQRQRQVWERLALSKLRLGDPVTALDAYQQHGRIHVAADPDAVADTIAVDYEEATGRGDDVLVLGARRTDVARLNQAIRQRLADAGRLCGDELTVETGLGTRSYREGDRILVTVNDRRRGMVNGARGTITSTDPRGGRVQAELSDGRRIQVALSLLEAGAIDHGYATTVHRAQGLTVDTTLVYGLGPLTREHGYVALSRGRSENHIYLAADTLYDVDCGPPRNSADATARSLTAELVERLKESGRQQLASAQLPAESRSRDLRDDPLYRRTDTHQRDAGRGR